MEAIREILRRYKQQGEEGEGKMREVASGEVRDFGALLGAEEDM